MYEVVNPSHPDKIADRIAGAIVDYAYILERDPKIAVEVLLGHGECKIIIETSARLNSDALRAIAHRIAGDDIRLDFLIVPQDEHLAENQENEIRCGDNGIFRGVPRSNEQIGLNSFAKDLYKKYPSDGKYLVDNGKLIICQSNAKTKDIIKFVKKNYGNTYSNLIVNPLGEWTGGTNVDCGATNRKLGSDMGDAVTGGGLHGKDLSKGDVSINIYAFLKAQETKRIVNISCAIGDTIVDGKPYKEIVELARDYIKKIGGFEKLAEWGLSIPAK